MERTITVSERLYTALQRQAMRSRISLDTLVESWLKQHLDLERYPELEWRQGPGGWRVGIKHPRAGDLLGVLTLDGGSVATSGDYQRYVMVDDRRFHHVLDPSTGYPARGVVSVTVTAEAAMDADALATAVFVMGPEHGMWLVEELEGVEAIIVTGEKSVGEILISSGLRGRFDEAN